MEQGAGISIISPPGITESSMGKSKSIGISLRSSVSLSTAKEKLKTPWLKSLLEEDAPIWDRVLLGLAEMIGTAMLVFIGCMGCVGSMGFTPPLMQISFGFGFAVLIAIQCVGHISGCHINPSVSVGAMILGKLSLPMTMLYILAQCFGGILGFGMLKVLTPQELLHDGNVTHASSFCATDVHEGLTVMQGFLAETIATGILVFFACGVWDARNEGNADSAPIRFGLCISVLCFVFVPYTGCSLNPARSIGPAIWNGYWSNHWVYWIGPIAGSIIASLLYRCLFLPKTYQAKPIQESSNINMET